MALPIAAFLKQISFRFANFAAPNVQKQKRFFFFFFFFLKHAMSVDEGENSKQKLF